jgi:hypothetical protein
MATPGSHTLPGRLAYGELSIYGINQTGINGITVAGTLNFGIVAQLSPYGINYTSLGQSVLFNGTSAVCKLAHNTDNFVIINESSIIFYEIPPI